MTYEALKRRTQQLQREGTLPRELTRAERADWAYGNAVIENDLVTIEMAQKAVSEQFAGK